MFWVVLELIEYADIDVLWDLKDITCEGNKLLPKVLQ